MAARRSESTLTIAIAPFYDTSSADEWERPAT